MGFFKNTAKNYLLYVGAVILLITYPAIFIVAEYFDSDYESSRTETLDNFKLIFILAVTAGPIAEELSFRGYFTQSKFLNYLSYLAMPVYIIISGHYYVLAVYAFFLAGVWLKKEVWIYVSSSVVFALIHFTLNTCVILKKRWVW